MACRRPVGESGSLHVAWAGGGLRATRVEDPRRCRNAKNPTSWSSSWRVGRWRTSAIRPVTGAETVPSQHLRSSMTFTARRTAVSHSRSPSRTTRPAAAEHAPTRAPGRLWSCRTAGRSVRHSTGVRLFANDPASRRLCWDAGLNQSVPSGAEETRFCEAFHAAAVPVEWQLIEPVEGGLQLGTQRRSG